MTNWGQMKFSNVLSCGFWQLQIYFTDSRFWRSAGAVYVHWRAVDTVIVVDCVYVPT